MIQGDIIYRTMIRKAYWSGLALIILALAVATGCSSSPQTPPATQIVTVSAGTCTAVNTCTGPFQQNTVIGTPFASTFSATVFSNGTPVVGATVSFAAPSSGASGNFGSSTSTTATTNANGVATSSTFTANGTVGTYIVVASTSSTQSTGLFSMANTLQPAPISVSGGNLQSTSISTQFANSFSVTVKDGSGNPVGAQLPVTFTVVPDPVTGASGTFADSGTQNTTAVNTTTALTSASGVVTSAAFSADSTAGGPYTVTVTTVDGDPLTASIVNLYNTLVPATITSSPTSTATAPLSAAINTAFPPLTVTVMTAVNGSTPSVPVQYAVVTFTAPSFTTTTTGTPPVTTISASSGTFADSGTVTTTAVTDVNGMATAATFTANGLANATGTTYNVTASVVVKSGTTLSTSGETPTQNFVLTNTP